MPDILRVGETVAAYTRFEFPMAKENEPGYHTGLTPESFTVNVYLAGEFLDGEGSVTELHAVRHPGIFAYEFEAGHRDEAAYGIITVIYPGLQPRHFRFYIRPDNPLVAVNIDEIISANAKMTLIEERVSNMPANLSTELGAMQIQLNDMQAIIAEMPEHTADELAALAAAVTNLQASVTLVKAQSDKLQFNARDEVLTDPQSINGVILAGTGAEGDLWRAG